MGRTEKVKDMDEQAITLAAEEAVNDLQLDCKINKVSRSQRGDQWCVQFSGKYGQFCDDLKNQFGKDNSARVVQEKIKSHLLKQVTKIRSSTGKTRRPRTNPSDEAQPQSTMLSAPLQMIEDAFNRATEIAAEVVEQAAGVAGAARETVANVAESIIPVTVEIRSDSTATAKESRSYSARKLKQAAKATSHKTAKKRRSVSRGGSKKAKKPGKVAAKVSKGKKAESRRAKKSVKKVRRGKK
jgi:hypothetical protein